MHLRTSTKKGSNLENTFTYRWCNNPSCGITFGLQTAACCLQG